MTQRLARVTKKRPCHEPVVGLKFGRLTILHEVERSKNNSFQFLCVCDCGNQKIALLCYLKRGAVASCGCLRAETSRINAQKTRTHGQSFSPTYTSWTAMKERCLNPKHVHYASYGGRGITICDRWMKFENFYQDMGERPEGMTLDRINNNGNYEPTNCRWATNETQSFNRRSTKIIEYQGKRKSLSQWARSAGLNITTLRARLQRGWSFDEALNRGLVQ